MIRLVTIKFRDAGRQYDFNAQNFRFDRGEKVIVETDRGRALATVVVPPREVAPEEAPENLKSVLRPASQEDLTMSSGNSAREEEAQKYCKKRIHERKLAMKLVRAEYLFDGSKIIFYFTADGRIDFRELVKDLAHHFHTRIEMRQIGVRDEAKMIGGLGVCGRELCCCSFLTEFSPVSVKMAKEQGLALNPGKISGQCGRLLCCLGYEYETYSELKKGLPKCGRKLQWDGKDATVCDVNILQRNITLYIGDGKRVQVSAEEFAAGLAQPGAGHSCGGKHHGEKGHVCGRQQQKKAAATSGGAQQATSQPSAKATEEGADPRRDGRKEGEKKAGGDGGQQRRNRNRNRNRNRQKKAPDAEANAAQKKPEGQQPASKQQPTTNQPPAASARKDDTATSEGQTEKKKRVRRRGRRRGRGDKPDSGDK